MMTPTRTRVVSELLAFAASGTRSRAVVLTGDAGVGISHTIERLHAELLAVGHDVLVVDDAHELDDAGLLRIEQALAANEQRRVVVGGRSVPSVLLGLLARHCEVRPQRLAPLEAADVRSMVAALGVPAYGGRAAAVIRAAQGLPSRVLELAFDPDLKLVDDAHETLLSDGWCAASAARLDAVLRDDKAHLRELVAGWEDAAPTGDAEAMIGLADMALLDDANERAIELLDAAMAELDADDDAEHRWAAALRASGRAMLGDVESLLEIRELAGEAERSGQRRGAAAIQLVLAQTSCMLADVATTRRAAMRAIELADEIDAYALAACARMVLADMLVATGQPGEAAELARDIIELAEHAQWPTHIGMALVTLIRAELAAGRHDEAAHIADRAMERAFEHDVAAHTLVTTALFAARAHAACGSRDVALATLDRCASAIEAQGEFGFWLDLEAVRVLASIAGAAPTQLGARIASFTRTHASTGFGGALEAAHAEIGAWKAHAAGAGIEAGQRAARARELWTSAACLDELSATDEIVERAVQAQAEMDAAAAPGPQADPAAFEVLTRREREIARYVAGGMTNPEIAAELHLSARTVEHHVASILRKLELPNRRALVLGRV